jgi:hypothetical protein
VYFFVWAIGFLALQYLTRTPPYGWPTLILPFALPVILVAIGALAAKVEGRDLPRPSSLVAWSIVTTFSSWIFPADVRIPGIHQFILVWWGACAVFSWLVLPALIGSKPGFPRRADRSDDGAAA